MNTRHLTLIVLGALFLVLGILSDSNWISKFPEDSSGSIEEVTVDSFALIESCFGKRFIADKHILQDSFGFGCQRYHAYKILDNSNILLVVRLHPDSIVYEQCYDMSNSLVVHLSLDNYENVKNSYIDYCSDVIITNKELPITYHAHYLNGMVMLTSFNHEKGGGSYMLVDLQYGVFVGEKATGKLDTIIIQNEGVWSVKTNISLG